MKLSIITLFPEMFSGVFEHSILKRAQEKGKVEISLVNLRDFGIGSHKTVDDKPYGGGVGMVLRVDVLHNAIKSVKTGKEGEYVVIMDARGEQFSQEQAEKFTAVNHLIIVCGRYEGFDERIVPYVDAQISIGDYILTGGEIPAMVIADAVTRLVPGVLEKSDATSYESFSLQEGDRTLEHPQYTRPETYEGVTVPDVLVSGHAKNIREYRAAEGRRITQERAKRS